eukprot:UC1_evm1s1266
MKLAIIISTIAVFSAFAGAAPAVDECAYTSQSTCDAVKQCTWCTSAAVPSSCHTVKDAAGLPPAVFKCDKSAEEEVDECAYTSQSTCDAVKQCT